MTSASTAFLTERAGRTRAYEATCPGDLGRMFETFKMYPDVAVQITQLTLDEKLDSPYESGILDFAECSGTTPNMEPIGEDIWEDQDYVDDEDCKEDAIDEADDSDSKVTAPVLPTAQPVTALDGNEDDTSSVISESSSLDTVTSLTRKIQFDYRPPTAATVEQRLQEAVDDFQLSWEISRVDENDNQITPDQYLKLLRAMLAICGNVAVLVLPESWQGVIEEVRRDYFPNLEELIVYRDELVEDDE
ncbi:hypothetical protein E8E11_008385 [Didymella keratinophila]|nr:hypothetical protein E8E11_008385 [Didymella keratinophila]